MNTNLTDAAKSMASVFSKIPQDRFGPAVQLFLLGLIIQEALDCQRTVEIIICWHLGNVIPEAAVDFVQAVLHSAFVDMKKRRGMRNTFVRIDQVGGQGLPDVGFIFLTLQRSQDR